MQNSVALELVTAWLEEDGAAFAHEVACAREARATVVMVQRVPLVALGAETWLGLGSGLGLGLGLGLA